VWTTIHGEEEEAEGRENIDGRKEIKEVYLVK